MLQPGQLVRVNLAGLQAEGVMFQAAVTDAVGHIVKQTSEQPPKYLVKLLFSFRGVSEVEVPGPEFRRTGIAKRDQGAHAWAEFCGLTLSETGAFGGGWSKGPKVEL